MKLAVFVFVFLFLAQGAGFSASLRAAENPLAPAVQRLRSGFNTPPSTLAPAVQFNEDDYKNYFLKSTDHKINLRLRSMYKITCDYDILGVNWGDEDNIKMFDEKNEANEIIDMKSVVFKTKFETYTYMRIYKASKEIVNLILNINPMFDDDKNIDLGLCRLTPYGRL